AGQGLLVYLTVQKKNEGASIEETAEYAKNLIPHICHWFTVDDLVYLKRGGRVSATAAFFGNALGIKPVMHVDDEGHLVPVAKVRGRKTSISTMADMYTELAEDLTGGTVFISHGDCIKDAELLAKMLKDKHGVDVQIITSVGTVIGAHSGPGTLALFFVGKHK
ncbi:MAG: DegV family protein, partial [Ruminococcaceae bacterium]|nr:DegV family protein [Oscillospiraceae bacterium]